MSSTKSDTPGSPGGAHEAVKVEVEEDEDKVVTAAVLLPDMLALSAAKAATVVAVAAL